MTPELLQRVAKCAPEWMGASYRAESRAPNGELSSQESVAFKLRGSTLYLDDVGNRNAKACFLMIDAMLRMGIQLEIRLYPPTGEEQNRPVVTPYLDSTGERFFPGDEDHFIGDDLTEAVSLTFVKVFEKEEA